MDRVCSARRDFDPIGRLSELEMDESQSLRDAVQNEFFHEEDDYSAKSTERTTSPFVEGCNQAKLALGS